MKARKPRRTGIGDGMQASMHWEVCAVGERGQGLGRCGHNHANQDEATACDWAPDGYDTDPNLEVCDLLVRQIRDGAP